MGNRRRLAILAIPFGLMLGGMGTCSYFESPLAIDMACESASSALIVATVYRAQGKLMPHHIASVGDAIQVIDPICGAAVRPSGFQALDMVEGAVLTLSGVNATAGGIR